jgi:hypothetical protein
MCKGNVVSIQRFSLLFEQWVDFLLHWTNDRGEHTIYVE